MMEHTTAQQQPMQHLQKEGLSSADVISDVEQSKFNVLLKVARLALLIHLFLIPTFFILDVTVLALANILSCAAWFLGSLAIKQGHYTLGLRLFCAEVIVHSVLVCAFVGTDSGFQFYLWCISTLWLLDYRMRTLPAIWASVGLIVVFAAVYALFAPINAHFNYPQILPAAHAVNVVLAGGVMVYAISLFRRLSIQQNIVLLELASKDPLTALYNRRSAKDLILKAQQLCERQNQPFCIVLGDVDHFKKINDDCGHESGDKILVKLAELLSEQTRLSDIVARWGGEEFIIALPNIDKETALLRTEALRYAIKRLNLDQTCKGLSLSMSFGLVEWPAGLSLDEAINLADHALYDSKKNGRDQTTVANVTSIKRRYC